MHLSTYKPLFSFFSVHFKRIVLTSLIVSMLFTGYAQSKGKNNESSSEKKIDNIIKQLTLEEKIGMCSGVTSEEAFRGVKRLGIPDIKCSDGPRGPNRDGSATAFPSGISLGSSWDPALVEKAGKVMGKETRAKGIGVLLAPGMNILRDPLNGRFFEYYTEDPFLNSAIAAAAVKGIQEEGVAACIKHYACNNREDNRNFYMSMVDDRTLHEIYLPAFKAAVQKGGALTAMTSANGVNDEFVSDSKKMLNDILKKEFGFKGFVMTDWLQTRSTEKAALAGLDISMPGGDDCGFGKPLLEAVKQGRVPISVIDDKVRRILRVYEKLGYLGTRKEADKSQLNTTANQVVELETAEQGMVLLKNKENVLPLQADKIHKVLVIGPNADKHLCYPGAGGSSGISAPFEITPLKGITNYLGADKVKYMPSEDLGGFQVIPEEDILNADGTKGFRSEYFVNGEKDPVLNRVDKTLDFMWEMKSPDPKIKPDDFRKATYTAKLIPPMDGKYTIRLIVNGIANMYHGGVTGEHLAFNDSRQTLNITNSSVELKKGVPYELTIEYEKEPGDAAIRLEWELPEAPIEKMAALDKAATEADAVIFIAGIDNSMDTEGRDRKDINFPGAQENLLNRLSKLNKNCVAVLINGSPLQLSGWLPNVPAVLEAWYPGMQSGTAIANVIFGKTNPSGKLTFSWPKRLEDVPCKVLGSENNEHVYYTDSLMVGYRYYDTRNKTPEFPFGFGLSYTSFKYSNLTINRAGGVVKGRIMIKNDGRMDGSEVVEVYVKPLHSTVFRPAHELKAFKKVFIKKGTSVSVEFEMGADAFSYFDISTNKWKVDSGNYEVQVGTSSRDIRAVKNIHY
jgi:beta-glucosidase